MDEPEPYSGTEQFYTDHKGQPIKVGDRVRFGVDENPPGVISRIEEADADYDDDLGRGVLYPPKVFVKYQDEEAEDWATGYNVNTSFYEPPVWEFEDIELLEERKEKSDGQDHRA